MCVIPNHIHISGSPQTEYPMRDAEQLRRTAADWYQLSTKADRDTHFERHGIRYCAFSRLPYFDPVRMIIIDPMHNLLLGTRVCALGVTPG